VRPDLVFVDLHMPGMDGAVLCRRLKGDPLHVGVPVVVLSGGEAPEERERAVRAEADDVIAKPVERFQLLDAARRLLHGAAPRGIPRIAIEAPARLRQRRLVWDGTARNLSRGGVFVETPRLLHARADLGLTLRLPETKAALSSTAQVIWTRPNASDRPPGMGLRFLGLDRTTARALADYVEERLPVAAIASEEMEP
jgi:uncharacterized protein (TIGR02266 family)